MGYVLLTVGIPTYNGGKTIRDSIDSIVCQLSSLDINIEILISDNASTDNTKEIIEEYSKRYPSIFSYYKNVENMGYDRNVDNVFKKANGDYVWLLADDDIHYDYSLSHISKVIREYNPGFIVTNFDFYDKNMKKLIHEMIINNGEDISCSDHNEFIKKCGGRYGNVSSIIIKKDVWNNFDIVSGYDYQYIHIYVLLHLLPFNNSYIVAKPMFKAREGSSNFEKKGDDNILVPLGGIKILKSIDEKLYDKDVYKKMLFEQRKYVFGRIKSASRRGIENKKKVISELYKYNKGYLPFWYKVWYIVFAVNIKKIFKLK